MGYRDRDVRAEELKHKSKRWHGWRKSAAQRSHEAHTGIGSNGAPDWDPEAPPTMPFVMRDIRPFRTQEGRHITSRSHLRAYEFETGTKQSGNDWTGPEKPAFHDELQDKIKFKAKKRKSL